ncbi:unnamed protein product [Dovyalis caffra]|uniref:F-box domain-containing protein n=1 Tax=Dovyalis caffra TaxID=77055 RepID=A0AAV1RUC7_9ROSI|nr:unnamed protein product [Dovyalis caffra]
MTESKTKRHYNQEITWRTELPDELVFSILSKIHNTKTLIRCYSVSKNIASFVSTIDTISVRVTHRNNDSLPCPQHDHFPEGAIPGLMKVFANMKSLKIRLCQCCSPPSPATFRAEVVFANDYYFHNNWCLAHEVGSLSRTTTDEFAALSFELNHQAIGRETKLVADMAIWVKRTFCTFYNKIFQYQPKTLSSWVTSLAPQKGFGSAEKVFMQKEQLDKFNISVSNSRVNENWLKNPQNVTYWLKNPSNENWLEEKVWLVGQREGSRIEIKRHVEKLLDAFNDDDVDEEQ